MSGTLVIAEHRHGEPLPITFELIAAALHLEQQGAGGATVAVVGATAGEVAERCGAEGVEAVIAIQSASEEFEPHIAQSAAEQLIDELAPSVILAGQTVDSSGYAPALAAHNRLGFASNVLSASWEDGALRATRGVYGDRLVAELEFDRPTVVLMVRAGAYAPVVPKPGSVSRAQVSNSPPVVTHLGYQQPDSAGVDITASEFLLSIGRGIEDEENVERFEALAEKLGATLSASRPLVDAGWVSSARQVGQSGRAVKPKVYLALGISGAVQHLAGIRDAEVVIAVNTDPEAPIFGAADYGAVMDLFDLAEELESRF
jgi:electron transfer flavoprotein alpha subunit